MQSAQADLKSARKRIEQLHGALKDHEEEYSGDEDQYNSSRGDSLDHLSSGESSYGDGDDESLDLSDTNDELKEEVVVPKSRTTLDRNKPHLSPARSGERNRSSSREPLAEDDEIEASRKARQRRMKELEEEERELEASRKARQERMKNLDAETSPARSRVRREPLKDPDDTTTRASPEPVETKAVSSRTKKKIYDSDDDDDLEEFLMKQRERMKNLEKDLKDDDDDDDDEPVKATKGISSTLSNKDADLSPVRGRDHVSNGKANGVLSSSKAGKGSREPSEDPPNASELRRGSMDNDTNTTTSRYRRKRQRRRTIEQLTSPEHKANGVDL